jgi:hypothetical protein
MHCLARLSVVAGFAGVSLASSLASAHVRLVSPMPRYPSPASEQGGNDANIKTGPCGMAGDSRTTDMSRITVLEPGATIGVQFNETIDHPGFYRISFDDDGQDAFVAPSSRAMVQTGPTFTLPVLIDNVTDEMRGGMHTIMVTLPNVECERCTLQLIQVMVNETAQTWDPAPGQDIYYTCADIALRRTGGMGGMGGMGPTAGAGGAGGNAGRTNGGTGGVSGGVGGALGGTGGGNDFGGSGPGGAASGGSATGGTATGGTATGGTATGGLSSGGTGGTPSTGGSAIGGATTGGANAGGTTPSTPDAAPAEDEGGCRMAPARKDRHAFLAAAVLALALAFSRRRGSRSSAA